MIYFGKLTIDKNKSVDFFYFYSRLTINKNLKSKKIEYVKYFNENYIKG